MHVWIRLCESEPLNDQPATATILSCDDGKTVKMLRKPGQKPRLKETLKEALSSVSAEGVAAAGKPLAALHEPILAPLVDFVSNGPPEFGPGKVRPPRAAARRPSTHEGPISPGLNLALGR